MSGQLTKGNSDAISSAGSAAAAPLLQAGAVAVDAPVGVLVLARRERVRAGISGHYARSVSRESRHNGPRGSHAGNKGGGDDGGEMHGGQSKLAQGWLCL